MGTFNKNIVIFLGVLGEHYLYGLNKNCRRLKLCCNILLFFNGILFVNVLLPSTGVINFNVIFTLGQLMSTEAICRN